VGIVEEESCGGEIRKFHYSGEWFAWGVQAEKPGSGLTETTAPGWGGKQQSAYLLIGSKGLEIQKRIKAALTCTKKSLNNTGIWIHSSKACTNTWGKAD
jgi:hypothetical protein